MYAPKTYITILLDDSSSMSERPVTEEPSEKNGWTYGYGTESLWTTCVRSLQSLIDRLVDNYRPEQGAIMIRVLTFSLGVQEQIRWTDLRDLSGTEIRQRIVFRRQHWTNAQTGIWEAIEGVFALNNGDGMELEAASVVVYLTDGADNGTGTASDEEIHRRITALEASGQWTFVCMYAGQSKKYGQQNLNNQSKRWGFSKKFARVFEAANASNQWTHLADQMLSYVDSRASGTMDTSDLKET